MARSGLTLKSRRRTSRSGAPTPGGFTDPYSGDGKSLYWAVCPPRKGNAHFYNPTKGDVTVPFDYFVAGSQPQGYVPLSEARLPGRLGPPGWEDEAGNPAARCGLMKFSTTSAQVGQWVTITTNFNVSDLRGVKFGDTTLGMAGTPQGASNATGEFQGISANQFRILLKKPGKYVGSQPGMVMRLTFYEYVNGAPYLSELCVSCNVDATHVLQVSSPAGSGKHPGGLAVPGHKSGAMVAPRGKPAARRGLTFKSQVRRPGIGFHPGLLAAAAHGAAHGAAVVAPIHRKKGSARALGMGGCPSGYEMKPYMGTYICRKIPEPECWTDTFGTGFCPPLPMSNLPSQGAPSTGRRPGLAIPGRRGRAQVAAGTRARSRRGIGADEDCGPGIG